MEAMPPPAKLKKIPKHRYPWEAAWLHYLAGATQEEIASVFNIPFTTVVTHSAAGHWSARRAQAMQYAKQSLKTDLKGRIERHRNSHQHKMLDQLEKTMDAIEDSEMGTNAEAGEIPIMEKLTLLDKQDTITRRVTGMDKESDTDPTKAGFILLASMSQANLVNESEYEEAVIVEEPKRLPDAVNMGESEAQTQSTEGEQAEQNDPSPLSNHSNDPTDPFLGILRSKNGHTIDQQSASFHPFAPLEPQIGATGLTEALKPLPATIDFTPPKPLVNENQTPSEDQSHE